MDSDNVNTLDKYIIFINMWSPDRIINNMYWKIVGKALRTIGDQGLNIWIGVINSALLISTKDSFLRKYKSAELVDVCTKLYKDFVPGRIDAKSLAEFARIDNPKRYDKWHNEWIKDSLLSAKLASAFYRTYWLNYLCDRIATDDPDPLIIWYQYNNNRFTKIGLESLKLMKEHFVQLCQHLCSGIKTEDLFNKQFLDSLSDKFYVPCLNEYIDNDPELTLLLDGKVIVANKSEIFIRNGILQDYLIKSFGVCYNPTLSWEHKDVKEFMDWCFIMWIDKDLIHNMLKFGASLLYGNGGNNKIFIWIGESGNNMKTTYQKAIYRMCGNKSMIAPIGYFTECESECSYNKPCSINCAAKYESDMKGIRILFSEEPDNKPLSAARIKYEVGGDDKINRKPLENPEIIKFQHKSVIISNILPSTCQEPSIMMRTVKIPFGSQAVYTAPYAREDQIAERKFPRDPFYDLKLPIICDAMLWVFFNYYQHYIKEGL
jgi:hypothetical protein